MTESTDQRRGSRGFGRATSKPVSARLPNHLADRLAARAQREGRTVADVARDALVAAAEDDQT